MLDGWFARFRGPGWGKKRTQKDRVEWHEVKNGVFYLHEQAARTEGGRGLIAEKVVVRCLGQPMELGQRLHWEAVRGGLGRAKDKLVLGDGIAWIWKLKADRWPEARELLDFGMVASTCGSWDEPAMAGTSLKLRRGWKSDCTNCVTATNNPFSMR